MHYGLSADAALTLTMTVHSSISPNYNSSEFVLESDGTYEYVQNFEYSPRTRRRSRIWSRTQQWRQTRPEVHTKERDGLPWTVDM